MPPVPYHLGRFPPSSVDWARILPLAGQANRTIGRYEGMLLAVPDPDVLLSPLMTGEAVLSSRIEGTQATLGEVLEFEAAGAVEDQSAFKIADIQEILNYRSALREGQRLLAEIPLSQRLVRHMHAVLMHGVRGRGKAPGEYRRIANWIGPPGCTIEDARYLPPGAQHLDQAMTEWEAYLHDNSSDRLVQLAISHAEFEAIHPFLDGNGRLGRLLIPLFLYGHGLLARPNFYISGYFESHRDQYYERLLAVSRDDDWTGWILFFLEAIIKQADDNQKKIVAILDLYRRSRDWLTEATRSPRAVQALDWMFGKPIFLASDFIKLSNMPSPTARRILTIARKGGLLLEIRPASGRRAAILAFTDLVNIVEGRTALSPGPKTTPIGTIHEAEAT